MADPGFELADVSSWTRFVESGELARTLTRTCVLVESRLPLAYELTSTDGRLALTVTVGEVARAVAIAQPEAGALSDVADKLAGVLHGINEAIAEAGRGERLALVGDHRRRRIVVADADLALDDRIARRLDENGSLLGLVAAYVERLARFAGLEHVTCEPRWHQDPGVLTFTLAHRPAGGGGLQTTIRVRYMPELDVQPILDDLNNLLRGTPNRLYRIARGPDRVDVALIDKLTAVELRRRGELVEHPARTARRVLADSGFELPALSGPARYAQFTLRTAFARLAVLARGIADLAADVTGDDDAITIRWTVNGRTATTRHAIAAVSEAALLGAAVGALNRLLAGVDHRVVVMAAPPVFHTHRMLLLDREWLAVVAGLPEVLPGCLDDTTGAPPLTRVLGAFPAADPATPPPRLPRLNEIIRNEQIHSSDFKCSARPSDLAGVIEEVARFARVAVEVAPEIGEQYTEAGREFVFTVSYRGAATPVRMPDKKYADVSAIVDYLNAILETRSPRRLLHFYRGGGYSAGLVRASDEEAERLRVLGYI